MPVDPDFDRRFRSGIPVTAFLAGVDEAGRGPLAGPVVAAAVILDPDASPIAGVDDSKALRHEVRLELAAVIRERALSFAVCEASVEEIDRHNILRASLLAMRRAIEALDRPVGLALIDGNRLTDALVRQQYVIKGDSRSPSIASASILAKVHRDLLMSDLAERYPEYGFDRHKGYPTASHREAIRKNGPCPIHRRTFRGVKEFLP
ncbi:MAG: ribonuclease HII [Deltaproteobacteria bacterium]|nr:ribonuclease HII [Deltaproteobacteria bacterium]